MVSQLFTILLFASCGYACIAGGKDGRWISLFIIAAALLSIPASYLEQSWAHTQLPVFGVDLLLLGALVAVSLRSRHYWPLWMTGFHLGSIATHLATIAAPVQLKPMLYFAMQSFWSLPMLLVMVAGIMIDRRAARAPLRSAPGRGTHELGRPALSGRDGLARPDDEARVGP
jgi:peptidoglycan/LPS O-acetylase OafA/YrhL